MMFMLIWIFIIMFVEYTYIHSWSPIKGFGLDIDIFSGISKPQNSSTEQNTSREFNLEEWLTKYPKIEHLGNGCAPWNCQPTFNTTTDSWINHRVERLGANHASQNKEVMDPNQTCEYIFIGDSITFGWKGKQDIFDANFNTDQNGIIYARSGDIISDIGYRLKHGDGFKNMKQCLLNHPLPRKSIVLLIGTNNIGVPPLGESYDVALRDYQALWNQFAEFLEDVNKQQRVVLNVMAIFPRGYTRGSDDSEMWNKTNIVFHSINFMNGYLKSFIEHQDNDNMRFIDCNRDLLQRVGSVKLTDLNGESHEYLTG